MSPKKKSSRISLEILELLKRNPGGLDIKQIREMLNLAPGAHQHLDRRLRELDPYYNIDRNREGRRTVYIVQGKRSKGEWDYEIVSKELRARILTRDGRRCQMCGRNPAEDYVKLHIDHKIPRSWGGNTEEPNLWALCSACNEGKKDYFATFETELMKQVLAYESVHERIANLLRITSDQWLDSDYIEFVANFKDYQKDWQKRLRELRYLGLEIEYRKRKVNNRMKSYYKLSKWIDLPDNPSIAISNFERQRAISNRETRKANKNQE